jgi:glycosyltransferase involved in cell wall biosynthesis
MKNRKILHIIDHIGLGGAQTVIKGIFESQTSSNNIFLYSLRKKNKEIKINHKNIFIFNSKNKYNPKPLREIKNIIKKEKIEIIHCHLFKSQFLGWILKVLYFPKLKLIQHEHGGIFKNNFLYNFFINISQKQTDLFLAVSKATKNKLIKKGKTTKDKIIVLYNFVDLKKFNKKNIKWSIKKEREKLGIKKDDFVVGFAGRLVERKGWREFVKASKIITRKNKKIKFLIAGDGADKEKMIVEINKSEFKENIIYLGYFSNMVKFYSLLDCFVMPSYWEGHPMAQLEALSMECLTISSDGLGMKEIITNKLNGLLFEVKNVNELVKKIELIYKKDNFKKNLVKNGLGDVIKYSLPKYLEKLNKIYE